MKKILSIHPDSRKRVHLDILKQCLCYIKFFRDISKIDPQDRFESLENGCKLLTYKKYAPGSVLILYKDQPNECFINVRGKIGAFVPDPEGLQSSLIDVQWICNRPTLKSKRKIERKDIEFEAEQLGISHSKYEMMLRYDTICKDSRKVSYNMDYFKSVMGGLSPTEVSQDSNILNERYWGLLKFKLEGRIGEGHMFGELGLVFNKPRGATILSLSDIEVAYMDKPVFQECFGKIQHYEQMKKAAFFKKYVIRDQEYNNIISKFMIMFQRQYFKRGTIICKEGDPCTQISIVFKGEVSFFDKIKNLRHHSHKYEKELQKNTRPSKDIPYMTLSQGEMIGDDLAFEKEMVYSYSVKAQNDVILYSVGLPNFNGLLKNNSEVADFIKMKKASKKLHLSLRKPLIDKIKRQQSVDQKKHMLDPSIHLKRSMSISRFNLLGKQNDSPTSKFYSKTKRVKEITQLKNSTKLISDKIEEVEK